jgi:hypothetical protein
MRKDMLAARLPNEIEPRLDIQHRTEKSLLVNNFTEINIIVINITILTVYNIFHYSLYVDSSP